MLSLLVILGFPGCWKKSGLAEVLEKEHIAAREPSPTPTSPTPAQPSLSAEKAEASPTEAPEDVERELASDEIVVDSIVMKKEVRGTSRDPRAHEGEQWIVKLQMISDLRRLTAFPDKARWENLKVGDRVKVTYKQGKYTGSIWSVDIE
ncbi:MAG: hypothetical protein QOK24_335 [Verrucomicrobiota bacterium]|jgi:hypothetical protein